MSGVSGSQKGGAISWGPLAAILVTIAIFILSQLVVGIVVGVFFGIVDWDQSRVEQWTDSTSGQFLFILFSSAVTLGILGWFLRKRKANFRVLGFARKPEWKDILRIVVGFIVYFGLLIAATIVASQFLGVNTEQEQEIGFEGAKTSGQGLVLVFMSLVILPPIVEEILFRGFLFGGLRTKLSFPWAVVITSVLFAVPHLFASSTGFLWIAAVDTFVLSLVLCYMREKTGALWVPIGIHAIKNSLAFIYIFVV